MGVSDEEVDGAVFSDESDHEVFDQVGGRGGGSGCRV